MSEHIEMGLGFLAGLLIMWAISRCYLELFRDEAFKGIRKRP